MPDKPLSRVRYDEAFWRAHHEAWRQSELNQREYCEAQGIPLKAFGNWRAKFKAEPQPPARKLLFRRGGLSHPLSHSLSHSLSDMTNGLPEPGPIVPPAREGHRRRFSEADKRQIVEEAVQPGASLSEVARRYEIAARVLFRCCRSPFGTPERVPPASNILVGKRGNVVTIEPTADLTAPAGAQALPRKLFGVGL